MRVPWLTALVAILAAALFAVPNLAEVFEYDRAALARGELWRLVTGHLTHWTAEHLLWDVFALVLLGALLEARSRRALAVGLGVSALAVSCGLWLLLPEMGLYRGLSGLDSALFAQLAAGLLLDAWRRRRVAALLLPAAALTALAAKVGFEAATGATVFVAAEAAFLPVPLAHVLGLLTGLAVGIGAGFGDRIRTGSAAGRRPRPA